MPTICGGFPTNENRQAYNAQIVSELTISDDLNQRITFQIAGLARNMLPLLIVEMMKSKA